MADQALDKDGNVYQKGADGLYLPKYVTFGREGKLDPPGQPNIQLDALGSAEEIRASDGQPKERAGGRHFFHPSVGGESFVVWLAGTTFGALLIGAIVIGGFIADLLGSGPQIKLESWDSMFWGISLVISMWALSSEPNSSIPWPTWWLTISKWPRTNLLNGLVFVLVATLSIHWALATYAPSSTASPTQISDLSPLTASISSAPSYTATPESLPEATPTVEPTVWAVDNTDGLGVYLRSEPRMNARVGAAYPDGTQLTQEEADIYGDGHTWKRVRAPDGRQGYVPAEYVVSTP